MKGDKYYLQKSSGIIWDGTIDRFEVFRNNIEGHYGQIGAGYLFDSSFQEAYLERGVNCYVDFLDEVLSASQIKKDVRAFFVKWIQDYEDAFTELALLGQKTWNDDEIKKCLFVRNAQNIGLVDTVFEELVSDNSL
jgi:hypothetical protein